MKFFHSIRWRLQLCHGTLLFAILSSFGFTIYQLESTRQMRQIDEDLQRRLPALVESQHPARDNPQRRELTISAKVAALFDREDNGGFYYVVWLRHGKPVTYSATAPPEVPMPKIGDTLTRSRGTLREVFLFSGPGDCILVGRSIATDLAGLRELVWLVTALVVSVLVIGLAGSAWLVGRALRPVQAISAAAIKIATGDLSQRISIADSESELGQLASVLNSTFARLDAAFAQQANFTADAAHELRTPVTVMLTHAQNGLASDCQNNEHREAFEAIQRSAQRMRRLIESLLELARLDSGQEILRYDECDLSQITADCIELIGPIATQRGVCIRTELLAAKCRGDAERLAQVVTNLLTNAVEYNHENGEVRITSECGNGTATLSVTNTGPGISAENLPYIFDRFRRADFNRPASGGHSGLGLAITKAIVHAHGGRITVRSEPANDTTFAVILPFTE